MAEEYIVEYAINLQDNASAGLNKFTAAAAKLTTAADNIKQFSRSFNQIMSAGQKGFTLKIDTKTALKRLETIENKLGRIKNIAQKINIGGVVSGGTRNSLPITSNRVSARMPRGARPVVPNNIGYRVLGPSYIDRGGVGILDMFKGMGVMYGISAIGSGAREVIREAVEYQNMMQTAKNILRSNYKGGGFAASFQDMERIARDVGIETKFTASEVADAVKFFAMAGLDLDAIKSSIRPVADIALIGDTDLGRTADLMTNVMTGYRINPNEMRRTADIMTRTFTMSNVTLTELAESFKMAGSMLSLNGIPFETATAAFGVLGDAGIKGTMAGTTMRTILNNLRNPTKNQAKYWEQLGINRFDEYGLRPINEIFADLAKMNSSYASVLYDKLQKKYVPLIDAEQDKAKKDALELEYEKASEEVRKRYGGVDVYRLFRLTAAAGGGVLMSSIEKWNKMIEENFFSDGLSEKLADAKKRTIAGLWAQFRSAFLEGGLQTFEANESIIREKLTNGIRWLKSSEFTSLIRDAASFLGDMGRTLLQFTKVIMYFYEKFRPLVGAWLKFQLYTSGILAIVRALKGVFEGLLLIVSRVFPLIGGMTMTGKGGGLPLGAMLPVAWQNVLYGNPLKMAQRNKKWSSAPTAAAALGNEALIAKYQTRQANMQKWQGAMTLAGAGLGFWVGNNLAPQNGGMIGAGIGAITGSLIPMFASIPILGWIMAASTALIALLSHFVKVARAEREAAKAAEEYAKSLSAIDVEKWKISSTTDLMKANFRIQNMLLIDQTTKAKAGAEAWKKYWAAMNGDDDDSQAGTSLYDKDEYVKMLADKATGQASDTFLSTLFGEIFHGDKLERVLQKKWIPERASISNIAATNPFGFLAFAYALNENAKPVLEASDFLSPLSIMQKIGKVDDIATLQKRYKEKFLTPKDNRVFSSQYEQTLTVEDFKTKVQNSDYAGLLQYPSYSAIMLPYMQELWDNNMANLGKFVSGEASFAEFFNWAGKTYFPQSLASGVVFGDDKFASALTNTDEFKGLTSSELPAELGRRFKDVVESYEKAAAPFKPYILPMLNRTYWEQVLGADLKEIQGGFIAPTNANMTPYGSEYKWDAQNGYWTKNGRAVIPSIGDNYIPQQTMDNNNATRYFHSDPDISMSAVPVVSTIAQNSGGNTKAYNSHSTSVNIENITIEVKSDKNGNITANPQQFAAVFKEYLVDTLSGLQV